MQCRVVSRVAASRLNPVRLALSLLVLAVLAACGTTTHTARQSAQYNPSRYYPPPGTASDPWGPYIHEASGRFGVPELWIRRVMRQESGGQEDVISWAGAMGLMQVMPDTYDGLRQRYSLGSDPFDPHNNILAGTAYIREMYDRYGAPGFLAAYNAGPNRLDRYLNNGTPLPDETVNYVASIAPLLGPETAMSGPLAPYARRGGGVMLAARRSPGGCDPDAAYDPNRPCAPIQPAVQTVAVASAATSGAATSLAFPSGTPVGCDTDAAYDPARPCQPLPPVTPQPAYAQVPAYQTAAYTPAAATQTTNCDPDAAYDPTQPCRPAPLATAVVPVAPQPQPSTSLRRPLQEMQSVAYAPLPVPTPSGGNWAIQVGAFSNLATAQAAAEGARSAAPDLLRTAKIALPATTPFGSQVAFRARLFGLTRASAADACARLTSRGRPCMTVPPAGIS
jgi:hypothetical protein